MTTASPESPQGRSAPAMPLLLDFMLLLRVVATFLVVLGHGASYHAVLDFTQWPESPYIQSMAVTIFFGISGFTIAWVCDTARRTGLSGLVKFVFDRFIRLVVPLIPVLAIFGAVEWFVYGSAHPYLANFSLGNALGNAIFLQDLVTFVAPFGTNRPLWTLSIEFWVYIVYAAAFFGYSATKGRGLIAMAIVVGALWLLGDFVLGARGSGLPIIWILGAGFYYLCKHCFDRLRDNWMLLPFLAFVAFNLLDRRYWPADGGYTYVHNLLIFACFVLVSLLGTRVASLSLVKRISPFLGSFAYTTYLVHYPIMQMAFDRQLIVPGSFVSLAVTILVSYAASFALGLLFEANYKAIRDAIWSRLPGTAKTAPAARA